jgi:hypothetical protein
MTFKSIKALKASFLLEATLALTISSPSPIAGSIQFRHGI